MTTQPSTTDSTFTVYARDMYAAQSFELTAEQRAELVRRGELFRQIITVNGGTAPAEVTITVPVKHPQSFEQVGALTFTV